MAIINSRYVYQTDDWRRRVANENVVRARLPTLDEILAQEHRIAAEQAFNAAVKKPKPAPEKTLAEQFAEIDRIVESIKSKKEQWKKSVANATERFGPGSVEERHARRRAAFYIASYDEEIEHALLRRSKLKPKDPDICDLIREESE